MSNHGAMGRPRVNDPWVNHWPKKTTRVNKAQFKREVDTIQKAKINQVSIPFDSFAQAEARLKRLKVDKKFPEER